MFPSERNRLWWMIAVFSLALLVRAAWLAFMYASSNDGQLLLLTPDCCRYVQIGTYYAGLPYDGPPLSVHSGPIYGTPAGSILWSGPGYGLFLSLFFRALGLVAWPVLCVQIVCSSAACLMMLRFAEDLQLPRAVGLLAALFSAVSLTSVSLSCAVLTETLFVTLHLAGLMCLARGFRHGRGALVLVAAACFGAAVFVRGVTLLWPPVVVILGLVWPMPAALRRPNTRRAFAAAAVMVVVILGWSSRNYVQHQVFAFSEGGTLAARYFWTARVLASLDPEANTRTIQHQMEAENLARYGPEGTTFAEHHRDDFAVVRSTLRHHPWLMFKRFLLSAYQNAVRGSELHQVQLPGFSGVWTALYRVLHEQVGIALLILGLLGGWSLVRDANQRAAGLVLVITWFYFIGITGFEFWQGSRLCYPAQIGGWFLVATGLLRTSALIRQLACLGFTRLSAGFGRRRSSPLGKDSACGALRQRQPTNPTVRPR